MDDLPKWQPSLPGVPFGLFEKPAGVVVPYYKEHIERDVDSGRLSPAEYWIALRGFLVAAEQTYASICLLLADKRPKPLLLQASILNRTLFEILTTVVALTEDPETRIEILQREQYQQLNTRINYLSQRWGTDSQWIDYLEVHRKYRDALATRWPSSTLPPGRKWPTPGVMINGDPRRKLAPFVSGSRHAVLKEIYEFHYPHQSAQAHGRMASVSAAMLVDCPSAQWNPGHGESAQVFTALLFLACIVRELEFAGDFPLHAKLAELWMYLREYEGEAKELWNLRYEGPRP